MVSPSKLQQPQQQQVKNLGRSIKNSKPKPERKNGQANLASASSVRIQKGPKPLEKKLFYLDVKNHALSSKLEARIKELGGGIELFLGKNVHLVITDRSDKQGVQGADKHKWGYTSGGSGGPPSLRSIEVQTPTPTPPTPYRSVEGPLSNSTNQRGQSAQRSKSRVDAMLERALTQPQQCSVDPLSNAISWGIPIWSTYELHSWLEKICATLNKDNNLKRNHYTGKQVRIKHLKKPFIKFESYHRESRPVFLELQVLPILNFDGEPGTCPFDVKRKEKKEIGCIKDIKENRDKNINPNLSKGKDMTRRPRATATRVRKTENTGYCEICRIDYKNLAKHLQSDQHLNFVRNDKNFLSLDNLISTGASVEAFLKINRSKDVRKECGLFPSRDHSLDNGILSSDEKSEKRNKSDLDAFGIDEMKMMQYNGARRNLNLDSTHNLRTRTKHESGHLLRSKGRPWHEEEKPEKYFDKYVIKKQSKGTIWIEENDSEDDIIDYEVEGEEKKPPNDRLGDPIVKKKTSNGENLLDNVSINGDLDPEDVDCKRNSNKVTTKDSVLEDSILEVNLKTKINGYEKKDDRRRLIDDAENDKKEVNHVDHENDIGNNIDDVIERLAPQDNEDTNSLKSLGKEDRSRSKSVRRGGRGLRTGRHRLSVEERLIEDNKEYYKVEVLGNKLRSSTIPCTNIVISSSKESEKSRKEENKPSSEKPVVVRFKRVRKSELSLLSDEAESFMFGDPRRDEEESEDESVLPKDTESDREQVIESMLISSSPAVNISTNMKQENLDDDSQDSTPGRARKRRRTQTEALLMDNTDYYKFETPGSRLRYQAPLTGVNDLIQEKESLQQPDENAPPHSPSRVYPSKPSPEVEKMHFSFEAVPRSEPWYQTYKRQDEGDEYYYFFSEIEEQKPFLLPYEIDNFPEILQKRIQNSVCRKRGRGRGAAPSNVNLGNRPPRKSPRCHASTLAIMSTIIRRREPPANLSVVEEEPKKSDTAKSEKKQSEKSDIDEDLKEIVKNIDHMLSDEIQDLDAFSVDILKNEEQAVIEPQVPLKGPPDNLLELLDSPNEIVSSNGLENSSCASSECGELGESPLKRRKKRKNKTGWPHKMRRKLQMKHLNEELQKFNSEKKSEDGLKSERTEMVEDAISSHASHDEEGIIDEKENEEIEEGERENEIVTNFEVEMNKGRRKKGRRSKSRVEKDSSRERSEPEESSIKPVLKSVFGEEVSSRKRQSVSSEKEELKCARLTDSKGILSSISEDSEEDSMSNNENVCTKETNLSRKKKRRTISSRKRNNTTSSEASNNAEAGQFISSPKKSLKPHSGDEESLALKGSSKKRSSKKVSSFKLTPKQRKRLKRSESASEELANGITSSDVDQRRSSIDYQPVVRVTKIDDRVDGVAIASNRRLRSSSSPRSNMQPPKKRFRHAKKQLLKNS